MKAVVCIKHGSPGTLQMMDVPKPIIKKDEILVKTEATTVTSGDVALRKQTYLQFLLFWPLARLFFGVKNQRKKILGHEFSGVVESVGEGITRFRKGDAVFGTTGFKGGAHAEYLTLIRELTEKGLIKPVIDQIYPLEKIKDAHAYVETGRKKGNVVVVIN